MWPKLKQHLKPQVWQWRVPFITAGTVASLVIATGSAGWFQNLELATLDRFFRWRPKESADSRIVIVTIDESDITHVGQWPMSDKRLAQLIENIKTQQPRVIGLDVYRDLPVEPGHQTLVQVFKSTPNLIGVEKVIGQTVAPPPTLSQLDRVGIADLVLDDDGKVRRSLMSHKNSKGETRLSLGARVSLLYLEKEGLSLEMVNPKKMHLRLGKALFVPFRNNDGGYMNANAGGYQMLLNFRGSQESFQTISMTDVLENRIPPDLMRDRIVLIGAVAPSLNDFFFTPHIGEGFRADGSLLDNSQRTPGIVIHANVISQMVSGALESRSFIRVLPEPLEWLWIFLWSGTGATLAWGLRTSSFSQTNLFPRKIAAGMVLVGGSAIAGAYLAFLSSWWIPVVQPLVALGGAAIAVTDYQSRKLLRDRDRKLTQFLNAVPVGIRVVDTRGQPYFVNQKAKEILGQGALNDFTPEGIPETSQYYMARTSKLYPAEKLPIARALRGESTTANDIEIHRGDQIIPIEAWGTPIYDSEGNIAYAIVAFQDITDRKKAETERQEFIAELFKLNCDLELALDQELRLTEAAERFVPNQFLSFLGYESLVEVKLGDAVQKEMSVLFCDIRDFTTISESMDPEQNFKFINAYLSRMEPAIIENDGFIDKYIGDAIMALFGGAADDAVQAGIVMLQRLSEYNITRGRPGRPKIKIGIGINTGSLMLGTVGGNHRMDGTVISDAVNLASRVEGLTKNYGISLLITQYTFLELKNPDRYDIRLIDRVTVKGKSEQVTVYEVFSADALELREAKLATRAEFEKAVLLFHLNCFSEAQNLFEDCLCVNPDDTVSRIYIERCQQQKREHPIPTQP